MNLDSLKLKYLINSKILFPINKRYAIKKAKFRK